MAPVIPAPRLNPDKLFKSKWTAVTPANKEKHFIVTRVFLPEPPATAIELIELEAVHSGRSFSLHWRELTDTLQWRQGWL
ncbi:TIGR02450 family Trp-rich protein [Herbaspirillum sp. RTI4]|uniref:TIGR02450 family Trp-rich protein n=1 Tax=Herbaspirillum sp. RTI4 TaxID=3048640 RepID=UPI002AB59A57|nr:TIGR02450 family Trp-rich protein [Herbaspirillum sp. RTI4]MDY7577830.1 TIGR02450 family Trp-rich protein [Herbaspirillum sp. RTI4]MEA9982448.1 TIGR02450 family Trp-rich protein [Herbaspirillum sp. RTI4]